MLLVHEERHLAC